jgi:hypothetical protein
MASNATQLIFELHKGQAQFAYFLLGAAGGAIAFAIHETAEVSLADAPWPLGLAVTLWALSFAFGCFGIDARQDGLHANALFLQVFGDIPDPQANPAVGKVLEDAKKTVQKELGKPIARFRWQKWTLFAGALAYIGGHVMQMATIPSKAASVTVTTTPASKTLPSH